MSKTYFISDTHWGHAKTIEFDQRPFANVEEMDAELIRRWNAKVKKDDVVYVLGDMIWSSVCAESLIQSLNGQIILIMGNHDHVFEKAKYKSMLAGVKEYDEIFVHLKDGTRCKVVLSHYFIPFYNGYRKQGIHLHGHSHNSKEYLEEEQIKSKLIADGYAIRSYNVGCMHWNYEPVTLDEILEREASQLEQT